MENSGICSINGQYWPTGSALAALPYLMCLLKEICHNLRVTAGSTTSEQGVHLWTVNQEWAVHQLPEFSI